MGNGLPINTINYSKSIGSTGQLISLNLSTKPSKDTVGQKTEKIVKKDSFMGKLPKFIPKLDSQSGAGLIVTLGILYFLMRRVS